jgi:hypothetical protein
VPLGPDVTFFGIASASDVALEPVDTLDGIPVYQPVFGSGFSIVVEGRPGLSGRPVAPITFDELGFPDLQIQVDRAIGNGSPDVCDNSPPFDLGGVPGVDPPRFDDLQEIADAVNDLACRFVNGFNQNLGRPCGPGTACLMMLNGDFGCANSTSTIQFCALMSQNLTFPTGDTRVTVRLRDSSVGRNTGPEAQIIVRVPPPQ